MSGESITSGVETIVSIAKTGLSLFSEPPLNFVIYAGLLGIGISLIVKFLPRKKK